MEIEYPLPPLKNETRLEWERRCLYPWRMKIKQDLFRLNGLCERCGAPAIDLDEGIVPRSAMRGFPLQTRRLAFASCNLFLLCARCNREEAHQETWAFARACSKYGEDAVRQWYASLNLKVPRYEFMPTDV